MMRMADGPGVAGWEAGMRRERRIKVTEDGPYLVQGGVPLIHETVILGADGEPESWRRGEILQAGESYALCRCGGSARPPFCDGAHLKNGFEGGETALLETPEGVKDITPGDGVELADVPCRCSLARFCHRSGDAWTLTEQSADPVKRKIAIESAENCPSGRLTMRESASRKDYEIEVEPEVGVIHDTYHGCEGPLWVRGGIEIESADGGAYEKRKRVTLCRCGASKNKPFCDGTHVHQRFGQRSEK